MSKYVFKVINGSLECISKNKSGAEFRYVGRSINDVVNKIIYEDCTYRVKIKDNDMILWTENNVYLLKDYCYLLNRFDQLKFLRKDISETIGRNGYINLSEVKNTRYVPKRRHQYNGHKIIKIIIGFIVATAAVVTLYHVANHFLTKSNDPIIPEQPTQSSGTILTKPSFPIPEPEIEVPIEPENLPLEEEPVIPTVHLEFDELSQTDKAIFAYENYYDMISKYSKDFGLDANLMLGIATEERGVHSMKIDKGGGLGLMQVQVSVWLGEKVTCYRLNPNTNKYEKERIAVTEDRIKNLETNIETGCAIFQECLRNSKYNIPVAIQMYNMGYGTMMKILKSYAEELGITVEDVLNNPEDIGWIKYREGYNGDPKYLEKVNMWIKDNSFALYNVYTNELITFSFTNENEQNQNLNTM